MTHVYPKRDRWLALGLLVVALLLLYAVCVHPWWTLPMQEANQRISDLQERELRVRSLLQQAPQIQQQLEAARTTAVNRPGFLPEPTAELATAGLVQRLESVVAQASPGNRSCAIQNRAPLTEASNNERFQKVTVNVRLLCGTTELAAVLHALEGGTPRLFVESLDILSQRFSSQAGSSSNTGLMASFNLSGYLAPAGALREAQGGIATVPAYAPTTAVATTQGSAATAAQVTRPQATTQDPTDPQTAAIDLVKSNQAQAIPGDSAGRVPHPEAQAHER